MENYVNEKTTAYLEIRFKNELGLSVIPVSGVYQVDDMTGLTEQITGSNVIPLTVFFPSESKYIINIPASSNQIINTENVWEDRQVTVTFVSSGGSQGTDIFNYRLRNLAKI